MSGSDSLSDAELGRLGLLKDVSRIAYGAVPSLNELWDWMHGECDEARADEIISHLATDEDIYDMWQALQEEIEPVSFATESVRTELAETTDDIEPAGGIISDWRRTPGSIQSWLAGWPAGALAYSLMLVFSLSVLAPTGSQPDSKNTLWQQLRMPKSASAKPPEQVVLKNLQSIQAGVRAELLGRHLNPVGPDGRALPRSTQPCRQSVSQCHEQQTQLFQLGRLVTATVADCVGGRQVSVPEKQLATVADTVGAMPSMMLLRGPLIDWRAAAKADHAQERLCAAASTLLLRVLPRLTASALP